ncbi:MAG: hypothetical protein PWP24_580, partial [Clostridiales bacterium]|nr:hypothetical protein [Clostridiales bacterium]
TAYINKSNQIGTQFGLSYEFQMPVLDEHFFARTLDQIGMIVFFQGYPYGNARTLRYNQYAIAGAQIEKIPYYYITNENGEHCYHKRNCALLTNNGHSLTDYVPYDTKQECASLGAYPCSECRP